MNKLSIDIKNKAFVTADNKVVNVINNLKLELSNNELVCIIGPSGCGKTSLLNIISGLDTDFTGSIKLSPSGTDYTSSYVFQNPRLLPWRTVLENIQLTVDKDNVDTTKITHLLQRLGLENSLHSYPQHLSLGMQRRVALARGFYKESDVLLLDEPFVSLDPPTARKARELLIDLWKQQPRNILFVTHDLDEAIKLADRLLFISKSPSHIISEVTVNLTRDERTVENISQFKRLLKNNNPEIAHLM